MRNGREKDKTETTDIHSVITGYCKQLNANKSENLEKKPR